MAGVASNTPSLTIIYYMLYVVRFNSPIFIFISIASSKSILFLLFVCFFSSFQSYLYLNHYYYLYSFILLLLY
nr:MAG TPA: hypothetical protein [Crassvirales sp.]